MDLEVFTYTNKGGKPNNEDYLDYYKDENRGIFILADGLGGHGFGEIASNLVVETLLDKIKNESEFTVANMKDSFLKTNQILLENQEKQNHATMKTTAVVLNIYKEEAIWGHLGDSRLYYISRNTIADVTKDHSVTFKKFLAGEIPYNEIQGDEDRSSLLGVFGNKEKCNPEFIESPKRLNQGDAFLLCSDGFWEYVFDEEILIDFLKSENPKQWAEYMLLRHIKRTKPSHDNYSLITVFVE